MVRDIRLTESEDLKTVAKTTAAVGSGLVAVTPQNGLSGFDQIEVDPDAVGLAVDGCDSFFDGVLGLVFSFLVLSSMIGSSVCHVAGATPW